MRKLKTKSPNISRRRNEWTNALSIICNAGSHCSASRLMNHNLRYECQKRHINRVLQYRLIAVIKAISKLETVYWNSCRTIRGALYILWEEFHNINDDGIYQQEE